MNKPLVSIVIPTWQRHELLFATLRNIRKQTYAGDDKSYALCLEIIVIIDGLDYELQRKLINYSAMFFYGIRTIMLGRNWSGLAPTSFGIAPLIVGYLSARGQYIMPWCDDERALVPDHIENLVNIMDSNDEIDYVYPRVHIWRNGTPNSKENAIIGVYPPVHGQITHYMFRPENFIRFGFPDWGSDPVDWSLIQKWIANGAIGFMTNEVTFEHRLDR